MAPLLCAQDHSSIVTRTRLTSISLVKGFTLQPLFPSYRPTTFRNVFPETSYRDLGVFGPSQFGRRGVHEVANYRVHWKAIHSVLSGRPGLCMKCNNHSGLKVTCANKSSPSARNNYPAAWTFWQPQDPQSPHHAGRRRLVHMGP